jgi:hypothetical protein
MSDQNSMNAARRLSVAQQMRFVSPEVRQQIASDAIKSQKSILAWDYYSTVRFDAVLSGGGPFTYTIAAGTRKAFGYKIGDQPTQAGFRAGVTVGQAETSLLKPSETRDNADVYVWGLAAEVCQNSDAFFVKQLWRNAYVQLALSGTDQHLLGPLAFFPAAGGLYGASPSTVTTPPLPNVLDNPLPAMDSGYPSAGNYYRLPQPVIWQANGSGRKDCSLSIAVTIDNAIALSGVADRASASGVAPFTHPADGTVFVDIRWRLISISVAGRSGVA